MKFGSKEKRLCGGKMIVTNFKRLKPESFMPLQNFTKEELRRQLAICAADGTVYVNTGIEGYELVSGIFENFIPETRSNLIQYQTEYGKKFPNIKTIDDWITWAATGTNNEQIVHSLAVLMVPIELERRKIEREVRQQNQLLREQNKVLSEINQNAVVLDDKNFTDRYRRAATDFRIRTGKELGLTY